MDLAITALPTSKIGEVIDFYIFLSSHEIMNKHLDFIFMPLKNTKAAFMLTLKSPSDVSSFFLQSFFLFQVVFIN